MIRDGRSNLCFGDWKNHAILHLEPDRETIRVLVARERESWADASSMHGGISTAPTPAYTRRSETPPGWGAS